MDFNINVNICWVLLTFGNGLVWNYPLRRRNAKTDFSICMWNFEIGGREFELRRARWTIAMLMYSIETTHMKKKNLNELTLSRFFFLHILLQCINQKLNRPNAKHTHENRKQTFRYDIFLFTYEGNCLNLQKFYYSIFIRCGAQSPFSLWERIFCFFNLDRW